MTILQIRQSQRLRSDEERQAYEAVARAKVRQLERAAVRRGRLRRVFGVIVVGIVVGLGLLGLALAWSGALLWSLR